MLSSLTDAWTDLVLGGECVGCARPGRPLCAVCGARLPERPALVEPSRAGALPVVAAATYGGAVRAMVVGWKERGLRGLGDPLGELLAGAVALALGPSGPASVVLVPVPSRPSSVRTRGLDTTAVLVARAARELRRAGVEARGVPLLRLRRAVADQAGLDAGERAGNLAGAMACHPGRLARVASGRPQVLVCDDVVTSGATLREAARALTASGLPPSAAAVVAATTRR